MSKSFVAGFVAGIALLIVVGVGASRLNRKDPSQQKDEAAQRKHEADLAAELADSTPVQSGVLTERQRAHSKLFSDYKQQRGERTISFLARNATDGVAGTTVLIGQGQLLYPDVPENYFGKLSRESDSVVRGRVVRKTSQITEDDAFIFTDYDVEIAEILKNNSATPLSRGAIITVTRPGGKVVLDGTIVKAADLAFSPLPANHDLLLFLKFVPETGAYQTTHATGAFDLEGPTVLPLTKADFPPG